MRHSKTKTLLLLCSALSAAVAAVDVNVNGHLKPQVNFSYFPQQSLLRATAGASAEDIGVDFRLNLGWQKGVWDANLGYQVSSQFGDSLALKALPGSPSQVGIQEDDRRLVDLTRVLRQHPRSHLLHRLDRLYVGYTGTKGVVRVGRQAISWGNGLFYNPIDVFNPFDPAAVDREYKTGDDMVYSQYLRDNGDDIQAVWVTRRNPLNDNFEQSQSSLAVKYHGFLNTLEYDLLLAQHVDEALWGVGLVSDIGGAVWRADMTFADTRSSGIETSLVTNMSYSWIWGQKNVSGQLEYFFNGFGQDASDYKPAALARNQALAERLARNELFTVGKHYLASALNIEMTPLWQLTPSLFANLADRSALVQLVSQHDLQQELQLLIALNLPVGSTGSEFGGVDSGLSRDNTPLTLEAGANLFVQLAWYF